MKHIKLFEEFHGQVEKDFVIDLSSYKINREDYSKIKEVAKTELAQMLNLDTDMLSVDHFYDMSDFGGDKDLYVLEISHPLDEDDVDSSLYTYVFKEREGKNLIFDVSGDM